MRRLGLALLLAGAAGGAWAQASASSASSAPAVSAAPGLVLQPCRLPGYPNELRCGTLARPLDPSDAQSPVFGLSVVVIPATSRRKLADPVLLLPGGPGQSASALVGAAAVLFARLNARRDVVLVDPRGTGRSLPLVCAVDDEPLAREGEEQAQFDALMRCKAQLAVTRPLRGEADLRFFTTPLAAQDLEAVRRGLGVPAWNLVGVSYGTRLALEFLRQFPAGTRRVVIDGVAPPDMNLPAAAGPDGQAALDAVFSGCAAERACSSRHPQLRAQWEALLASLPRSVTLPHPRTAELQTLWLTRERLLSAVRYALYSPPSAAALPAAIARAAQGRFEALAALGASPLGRRAEQQPALGMHFSVICAEDRGEVVAEGPPPRDFGDLLLTRYGRICQQWPRGEVPAAFYRVPESAVPVLALSGALDPATPPRHGERVVRSLGKLARHVVVPWGGHGQLGLPCVREAMQRFIEAEGGDEALAVDLRCVANLPRPPMLDLPVAGAGR